MLRSKRIPSYCVRLCRNFRAVDMSNPHFWYPKAREIKPRNIICHVGPTNSGKTYNALKELQNAKSGIYGGPLRLLAWEVCDKLRGQGVRCNLRTGQERDVVEAATHDSCTVEMVDLSRHYQCAVLDEVQLIGDSDRGWAWTQALLGLCASEIHLCGSPNMLPLIQEICSMTKDNLTVQQYSRLSPLDISSSAVKSLRQIKAGDCVVAFSRKKLYEIKFEIENSSPHIRCCLIYGGLPPEARKEQARLFNSPLSGYDVLVASDAVGMGLNLAIRRIVFTTLTKFDGVRSRKLTPSELKQISGRAGRFKSQYEKGYVTCLDKSDLHLVRSHMTTKDKPVKKAGLQPTLEQMKLLALMSDYRVTGPVLRAFWSDACDRDFGVDPYKDQTYTYTPETVLRHATAHFITMGTLCRHLELYLISRTTKNKNNCPDSSASTTGSSDGVINSNYNEGSESPPSSTRTLDADTDTDVDTRSGTFKETVSSQEKKRIMKRHTLEELLASFKENSHFSKDSPYFLCRLDERLALAALVANLDMTLEDQFTFTLAPIRTEVQDMMNYFQSLAKAYACGERVRVNLSVSEYPLAKTPSDVEVLEIIHQKLGLYKWIGLRFPEMFVDMELAATESKICAQIVDESIRAMRPRGKGKDARRARKSKQKRGGVGGKRSGRGVELDLFENDYVDTIV